MKLANVNGRATLVLGDEITDVATASGGSFGPSLASVYDDWAAFVAFAGHRQRRYRAARRGRPRLPGA